MKQAGQRRSQPPVPDAPGPAGSGETTLTLRDVRDVDAYLAEGVRNLFGRLAPSEHDELVLAGVAAVRAINRALPPQRSLHQALEAVLWSRLSVVREQRLRRSRHATGAEPLGKPGRDSVRQARLPEAA